MVGWFRDPLRKKEQAWKAKFKEGDWVTMQYGTQRVLGQVMEDRGPLGVKGRRLYRVRLVDLEYADPYGYEMPEESLEPAAAPPAGDAKG